MWVRHLARTLLEASLGRCSPGRMTRTFSSRTSALLPHDQICARGEKIFSSSLAP